MSLHPRFAAAILDGSKRVEFRKRAFARPVGFALIYATKPTGSVVGAFEIRAVRTAPPTVLWERYGHLGCIAREELEAYYRRADAGVAIEIGRVWDFHPGVGLLNLGLAERPPQSYSYASLARLLDNTSCDLVRSALAQMLPGQLQVPRPDEPAARKVSIAWSNRDWTATEFCPVLA